MYEVFVATCRIEQRTFRSLHCLARIAVLSAVSLIKDVTGRTALFLFTGNDLSISEFYMLLYRVFDASFSSLLTLALCYYAFRVARSIVKSLQFQQKNSTSMSSSSSNAVGGFAISGLVFRSPLFRIVLSVAAMQCAIFFYHLTIVLAYRPVKEDMSVLDQGPTIEEYQPFWSLRTDHQIIPQCLSFLGMSLIYLSRL